MMHMSDSIRPRELAEILQRGEAVNLIDVRTPAEFQEIHVQGARNIPLHQLDPALIRPGSAGEPVYVICQQGGRGRQACEQLARARVARVVNVEGGTEAWVAAGLPAVRGRRTMSLERQVRVAAGSLVLIGVLLAWVVHPLFVVLSALIGAGLVFSGVTDTCGMGFVLSRAPWNLAATSPDCCASRSEPAEAEARD
jgi:rhodanese-related sulfurtransferase